MVNTGVQRLADQLQFLKVVPLLSKLPDDILAKLSDAFELVSKDVAIISSRVSIVAVAFFFQNLETVVTCIVRSNRQQFS